jgi:hypothetical protein
MLTREIVEDGSILLYFLPGKPGRWEEWKIGRVFFLENPCPSVKKRASCFIS